MSYFYAFLGFAALIVLHEAGHFAAAKAVGMRVERFSLFLGPMWLKRRIGETEYGIATIPLGGYVKITGMSPMEVFETPEVEARAYINQPVWKRIVVIAAGPAVNLVLAFLLLSVFYLGQPNHYLLTKNGQVIATRTIGQVEPHSAASTVLHNGDVLISADGVSGSEVVVHRAVENHTCADGLKVNNCRATTPVKLVVDRAGKRLSFEVYPRYSKAENEMLIGVEFVDRTAANGLWFSAGASISGLWGSTTRTVSVISHIFQAKDRSQLHSVAAGYNTTASYFRASVYKGFEILALISLSLGILNLLPFLPLDGGHILWALVEKVRRRPVSWVVVERASLVGVGLVLLLFAVGLSNDISTHFSLTSH